MHSNVHLGWPARVLSGLIAASALAAAPTLLKADHTFTVSSGVYRIPYANGTDVTVTRDHHDHAPVKDRFDMVGTSGAPYTIVAAADGIIRAIVDTNGDDAAEHSCLDDETVPGDCSDYNNYVWIEHANGEWTKYTHFETGTVTALGRFVGESVVSGTPLGTEGDVGAASGPHLHFEVAVPDDPDDLTPFSTLGGFIEGDNVVAVICDIADNLFVADGDYTAGPCDNHAPVADAGGPYQVNEGSTVMLDGTGSVDIDADVLSFLWAPAVHLDSATSSTPIYAGVDDLVENMTLTVTDQGDVTPASALSSSDTTTVTVLNVAPSVVVQPSAAIAEGGLALVSASFTDPGTLDTHTATITWGDGTAPQAVTVTPAPAGGSIAASHVYGDNGTYAIYVTVTDDDGGVGGNAGQVQVGNVAPTLTLDVSGAVSFPGGDFLVVNAGGELPVSAHGSDPGSDDLTFTWGVGAVNTYFNNGVSADPAPPLSAGGVFPFNVDDSVDAAYTLPGVQQLAVTLSDDDGGSDPGAADVLVTGNADRTQGPGWWKHQFSGQGAPHVDAATAAAYLAIVNAVSTVFSEAVPVTTLADAHAVLSPTGGDRRARTTAQLMLAWLEFASGAVRWDATVSLPGGSIAYLQLMADAEAVILNPAATSDELQTIELKLLRVMQVR